MRASSSSLLLLGATMILYGELFLFRENEQKAKIERKNVGPLSRGPCARFYPFWCLSNTLLRQRGFFRLCEGSFNTKKKPTIKPRGNHHKSNAGQGEQGTIRHGRSHDLMRQKRKTDCDTDVRAWLTPSRSACALRRNCNI